MKNLFYWMIGFASCVGLWGCPYESPYAIDAAPKEYADDELVGKWAGFVTRPTVENEFAESPVKVIFEKRSDMEYDVAITGYIDELKKYRVVENDTIHGTAFISIVDGREFVNTFIKGRYYIAEVRKDKSSFSLLTLAEKFTNKYIKNSDQLRQAISVHYKTKPEPVYDDWFIARNLQKVK